MALLWLTVAGCGHGEPSSYTPPWTDQPFAAGTPTQLTYGGGGQASWLPDGSGFVYSGLAGLMQYPDGNQDICLGVLAGTGGQSHVAICQPGTPQLDSVDAIEMPAVSSGGRLVFLHSALKKPQLSWAARELVLTSLTNPATRRRLVRVPQFSIPAHNALSQVSWLDDDHFVYRADLVQYSQTSPPVSTPLYVMLVGLRGDSAVFTVVTGLDGATNVAALDAGAIAYTMPQDTHVYRRELSSGATSVLWDFGAGREIRALQASGARLAARLSHPGEQDMLVMVDLDTRRVTSIASGDGYGALGLSPDGHALVAELDGNLYRFTLP